MLQDERELDVLGVKTSPEGGECLVIETKGQSITDRELAEEVKYFASKVKTLKDYLPKLAKEIGYDGGLNSITGIFASMARLGQFDHGEPDVALWDFDDFISELRAEHFPKRFLDLLEASSIAREWAIGHFLDTAWLDSNDWDDGLSKTQDELGVG